MDTQFIAEFIFFSLSGTAFFLLLFAILIMVAKTTAPENKVHTLKGLYIYVVSIISLGMFVVGISTGLYQLLATQWFPKALDADFQYHYDMCEQIKRDPNYLPTVTLEKTQPVMTSSGSTMSSEERAQSYADCKSQTAEQIVKEKDIQYNKSMLFAFVMMIVSFPIYFIHFVILRRRL